MIRFLVYLFICIICKISCCAQSAELKIAIKQVNETLKNYALTTREYPSYASDIGQKYYKFTKKSISYDYPNLIFEYTITHLEGGYTNMISPGIYKVIIPISSSIVYPEVENSWGTKLTDYFSVQIANDNGLTKTKDGISSIIKSFSITGKDELTAKKFFNDLYKLQSLLLTEDYRGKLYDNNPKKSTPRGKTSKPHKENNGNENHSSTTKKTIGKYVQ